MWRANIKNCKYCNQKLPEDFFIKRKEARSKAIRDGLERRRNKGLAIGRTREADYEKIRELRKQGLVMREIAQSIPCSLAKVQRALK